MVDQVEPEDIARDIAELGRPGFMDLWVRPTVTHMAGTVLAALAILLAGVVAGAIKDVPTTAVVAAIVPLLALLTTLFLSARINARQERARDEVMRDAQELLKTLAELRRDTEERAAKLRQQDD
jgi:hypothetical protein